MSDVSQDIKLNGCVYNCHTFRELHLVANLADPWQNSIFHFLQNWFDDTDFIEAQTSGSTGKPKTIRLLKRQMINSARMTNRFFGLNEQSTALLCLPASYIAGKMMLARALAVGFNLLTVEPSANPFEHLDVEIDFAAITPYQLFHSHETLQQARVRKIIVGGSPVAGKLEKLVENIPAELFETYGMTETCSHIALRRFNGKEKSDYFTVLDGVRIRLDGRGCLVIHAPHLSENDIVTNDLVEISGGSSFKWLGRIDSVINSGGIKIHPELLEKKLDTILSCPYFISSIPDTVLQNKVVLVLEKAVSEDEQQLKGKMSEVLEKYEMPKQIFYTRKFVYSPGNKILRKETLGQILDTME
ncbi:MAG TPA: AMP-binding protein [Paludibacter sp.]|nr:AMP-binding protein [Paludibacter sp.]